MQNLKSFLKQYSRKWYVWLGIIFLLLILIGSTADPVEQSVPEVPIPEQSSVIDSNVSQSTEAEILPEEKTGRIETTEFVPTKTNTTQTVPVKAETKQTTYKVTSVVDGDTIKVDINGIIETIRIIGLNTPETVDPRKPVECFGKEASNKAKELLSGKTVVLEADATQGERDKYGRLLRYVFLSDGTDYAKYMISSGYAYEYTYNTPYKYQASYKQAQKNAEASDAGLWKDGACNTSNVSTPSTGKYYTSTAGTKYYPESCTAWQSLSKVNLRSFNSLEELLKTYPKRTLASTCQ